MFLLLSVPTFFIKTDFEFQKVRVLKKKKGKKK